MQGTLAQAQDRLRRHRLEVQPTEMVELPDESGQGDPSGPAVIRLSAPDEGLPGAAIIPEPGPLRNGPRKAA